MELKGSSINLTAWLPPQRDCRHLTCLSQGKRETGDCYHTALDAYVRLTSKTVKFRARAGVT